MAPKKKNQQKKSNPKPAAKPDTNKPAPKIQISAENERRLRQLLLNTDRPSAAVSSSVGAGDAASRTSKAKRLRSVYDKLSLEGFTSDQIELALSALNEGATFDAALDWLCLNLPGNELPLKFSSGAFSLAPEERSVKIISTAQTYWNPPQSSSAEVKEEKNNVSIRVKEKKEEFSLDSDKSSQADWIRQYMEQQAEEEEVDDWEEEADLDPSVRAASIVEEYHHAKLGAQEAKQKKDKKSQKHFGDIIRKLKQELSSLGLSDDILESTSQNECTNLILDENEILDSIVNFENETGITAPQDEAISSKNETLVVTTVDEIDPNGQIEGKHDEPEMELDNLFDEDSCSVEQLPFEISKKKKKEIATKLVYGSTVVNIDEIWKKGDSRSTPKAYLQKICQRLGWEAPKYSKLYEKENKYLYSVSILRPSTGRGKSRKAGGLITLQLPEQDKGFNSVEEAQNSVAAFSLCQLFPDLPLQQMLKEQYASYVENWQEDDFSAKMEDTENIRRADFVDSLLKSDYSQPIAQLEPDTREVKYDSHPQTLESSFPTRNVKSKGISSYSKTKDIFSAKAQ